MPTEAVPTVSSYTVVEAVNWLSILLTHFQWSRLSCQAWAKGFVLLAILFLRSDNCDPVCSIERMNVYDLMLYFKSVTIFFK